MTIAAGKLDYSKKGKRNSMRLAIIGASAGIGRKCVDVALERSHVPVTLSRSPENLPGSGIERLIGNATKPEDLRRALTSADAVIVALGTRNSLRATTLYTDFARALLSLHQAEPICQPILIVTGFGAGISGNYHSLGMKLVFATLLKAIYRNKTEMEEMITASSLRWEMVRPGVLTNAEGSGSYRVTAKYQKGMKVGKVSRADVASFLVAEAEEPRWLGQYPAICEA